MKTVVVVQARVGSSRLPGKILLPLAGRPLLERMLERVAAATSPGDVVVATTVSSEDEPVRELANSLGVHCYSGHPTDLLDRHYQAAKELGAEVVVKIPSDCPLIDPGVIDRVIGYYEKHRSDFDFVSNLHPATYPDGNDVEVMAMSALETAWKEAKKPFHREHTTPFLWDQPERFRIGNVVWETGRDFSMTHRFTIDYAEDYEFVARVYDELWTVGKTFSLNDIVGLLERRPDIAALNAQHAGVNWYRHHLAELRTVAPTETRKESSHRLVSEVRG